MITRGAISAAAGRAQEKEIGERRELAIVYQRIPLVETVTCSKDRRLERKEASLGVAYIITIGETAPP
jgi:hypothetical protein